MTVNSYFRNIKIWTLFWRTSQEKEIENTSKYFSIESNCQQFRVIKIWKLEANQSSLVYKTPFKPFLVTLGPQVTGDPAFSMFNLSLKEDWINNKKFCHRLSDDDSEGSDEKTMKDTQEAQERLAANMSRQSSPNGDSTIGHNCPETMQQQQAKETNV